MLIETTKYPGTGKLNLTGKLGDVMKESVNTSLSWIKAHAKNLGIIKPNNSSRLSINVADDHDSNQRDERIKQLVF